MIRHLDAKDSVIRSLHEQRAHATAAAEKRIGQLRDVLDDTATVLLHSHGGGESTSESKALVYVSVN